MTEMVVTHQHTNFSDNLGCPGEP